MQFMLGKLSVRSAQRLLGMVAAIALSAQSVALAHSADYSNVIYQQDGVLSEELHIPIYEWTAKDAAPRAAVIALHGVAMHGKSFDCLGRTLAQEGYYVVATDMRGYGRSFDEGHAKCKVKNCRHKVNYDKSYDEVVKLARAIRERYPSLPIFGLGESMGTHLVLRLAAEHPNLVDGLVLSAPAVRRHTMIDPYLFINAGLVMANPRVQIDLMPFVRRYASDDPRVIEEMEQDPLLRRRMNVAELLKATTAIRKTMSYVPKVPADMPVLVIQGGNDRVLHADAVIRLLSKLNAKDETVKWFASRGHILLETGYVRPDTMNAVVTWLNAHADSPEMQSKVNRAAQYVATGPAGFDTFERASFHVALPRVRQD